MDSKSKRIVIDAEKDDMTWITPQCKLREEHVTKQNIKASRDFEMSEYQINSIFKVILNLFKTDEKR
jgi:hypothetical protein